MREVFVTEPAFCRHEELLRRAPKVSLVTQRAAELLSETVSPQGIVAVCEEITVPLATALAGVPRQVAVLVGVTDPGNAGTVLRVADAAGADAVVFAGEAVDVHNGKCVRASTGSLFHLPVATERDVATVLAQCRRAGLRTVAAHGYAEHDLTAAPWLREPTAWLFGSEAHGLPPEVLEAAETAVRVPILGRAESLNLATAAAVCLYARVLTHGQAEG
ncbi:TrmH family RNA methyltransferase [Saccharomonospora amisosensis]|uniref:TrmH family RNA methyltransferase n=1 Tax=Saccharomonospora amisosensis TaxID=1128677 RepID=A0A7X5ZQ81_9PSEU|nr:TrmH family RNA methyltransferase [Saccharomonospora amisosensis]